MSTLVIREVEARDIVRLEALEKKIWSGLGTAILSASDITQWFANHSPFFLVAEYDGELVAYYYGQCADFSMEHIDEYTAPHILSKTGYTIHVHKADGNSVEGLSVVSCMKGAARALNQEVYTRVRRLKKDFYFGYSRLSGFDSYLRGLPAHTRGYADSCDEYHVALWYAHESMKLINGKIWETWCTPQPPLCLPPPTVPDPVLSFHAKGTAFGLLRVVPEFMPDPESRNYGAFLAYDAR